MKKILFFLYGVIAYLIFFGTFSYAVGFVSTFVVPKHIDSIPAWPLNNALLIDVALLTLFALQHSVMARPAFKKWWTKAVPVVIERSTYVLFSSICLLLLFWYWQPLGGVVWNVESENIRIALQTISLLGFTVVLVSTFLINHFDLFGLRQVWLYLIGKEYEPLPFRTPFFYKYVRHPLYLGFLIAFWSTPTMTAAHLFFAIMTTGYIFTAIQFEERDLTTHFGDQYKAYKKSAPMILPFIKGSKGNAHDLEYNQKSTQGPISKA